MPAVLFSFALSTGPGSFTYGSHVLNTEAPLATAEALLDIQSILAAEYGSERAVLMNWDYLPGADDHSVGGPFPYFLSYFGLGGDDSLTSGSMELLRLEPLDTLDALRGAEEYIRGTNGLREVHLISCKPLASTRITFADED